VGKTAGELQNEIYNLFVPKWYRHLTVTVTAGERVYYVTGEVKVPGQKVYIGQMTVTKAITSAGDFTDFANHKKVWLIRANGQRIKVNCNEALQDATRDSAGLSQRPDPGAAPNLLMVQFNILSGRKAGAQLAARRFPFRIGRAPGNELQLDDDGIWDQHLTLEFNRQKGFTLATAPNALVNINGGPVQTAILRNGDIITLGSANSSSGWLSPASAACACVKPSSGRCWRPSLPPVRVDLLAHPLVPKCRVPVKTMARLRSSAAAMTSASRTEPPG